MLYFEPRSTCEEAWEDMLELLNRRKPYLKWLEPFGYPCTVLNPDGKFGSKSLDGFFMGYAIPLKRYSYLA